MSHRLKAGLLAGAALAVMPMVAGAAPLASFVPFSASTQVLGAARADAVVHFRVALQMRDADGLRAVNASHRTLTPSALEAYLPETGRHGAVLSWLRAQGLTIEAVPSSRMSIAVSGPASVVGRLLGVGFVSVRRDGVDYVSADREPVVPAAIAPHVLGIVGLEPQKHLYPAHVFGPEIAQAQPMTVTGGKPPLYPIDLLTAYSATGITNGGAGSTTAIIINTFPLTTDLTKFWSTTGVNQSLNNITFIQVVAGTLSKPGGEESLDVQQSSSIAPQSKVRVYATLDLSNAHLDAGYEAVISDMQSGVKISEISMSYGGCETSQSAAEKTLDDNYYATMTSLGATVMASSGDSGARECSSLPGYIFNGPKTPSFPSSSPSLAAIGGTSLKLNSASVTTSETGWSGSGGGVSKYFPTPSWQQGLGYSKRSNPDVSADADPNTGVLYIVNGKNGQVGGTSVSSPVWAGLTALINTARVQAGKPTLGLLPARTTQLKLTNNFRDITSGTNHGYSAAVGYDLVTGVGSPVMSNLLATLVAQP